MNARPTTRPAIERAEQAWAEDLPDWVAELARQCDVASQTQVAKAVGYSGAAISCVLRNKYAGDMGAVEKAVRGAFMAAVVDCPVLGELAANICLEHQRRPFAATNQMRVELYRACQRCPHARKQVRR